MAGIKREGVCRVKSCHSGGSPSCTAGLWLPPREALLPPQGAHSARVVTLPSSPREAGPGSWKMATSWKDWEQGPSDL